MLASTEGTAPTYVDIAHRAALMYSFASLVLFHFVSISPWSRTVNLLAVTAPVLFFAMADGSYVYHGLTGTTDNQIRDAESPARLRVILWANNVAQIGGVSVLVAGFLVVVLT